MNAVFEARRDGYCEVCTERIFPGDPVKFDGDGNVVCAHHADAVRTATTPSAKACPACFTIPAKNGMCACDE